MNKFYKSILAPTLALTLFSESFFSLLSPVFAKADDLVIQDDGGIVLVVSDSVMAVEIAKDSKKDTPPKAEPPATTSKVVVPPKVSSTVTIDPKPSSDNKVKITITTQAKSQAPQGPQTSQTAQTPKTSQTPAAPISPTKPSSPAPGASAAPTAKPQTTVDKVVLDGPNQKPIITISGQRSKELNIEQGGQQVSTSLPVQIVNKTNTDTGAVTHEINVGTTPLSVLPEVAIKAAENQVQNKSLPITKKEVTLSSVSTLGTPTAQPNYIVREQRQGKLFGLIGVSVSSEVEISGQTGKTNSFWQSPFSFLVF